MADMSVDPTTQAGFSSLTACYRYTCYHYRMFHEQEVYCPYCGEGFTAFIDLTQGNHQTVEDCYVCCRPIEFLIESDGHNLIRIETFTSDESIH